MPLSPPLAGPLAWHRFETLADASEALAEAVAVRLSALVASRGAAVLAVPGGSTPTRFLTALGGHDLDWSKVTVLPTDERFVQKDDPASNERMIREALTPLKDGRARFLSFHTTSPDLDAATAEVEAALKSLPPIDVLISGMGADGHIASLFPGGEMPMDAGLNVLAAHPPGLPERISLSPARLAKAGWAALLVSGHEKSETLASAQALPGAFPVGLLLGRAQGLDVYWAKA